VTAKSLSLAILALLLIAGAAYTVHWGIGEWGYRALLADRALSAGDRDASVKPEQARRDRHGRFTLARLCGRPARER